MKHSVAGKATLYVVVDQNAISRKEIEEKKKTEVLTTPVDKKSMPTAARSIIYSISQIIPFVNSRKITFVVSVILNETQGDLMILQLKRLCPKDREAGLKLIILNNLQIARIISK